MRVLHVDDDAMIRELIKISMGQYDGHEVASFSEGSAALEYLRTQTVDLIISDVMMPGMNGLQFVGAVRGQGLSTAPVVFLTSGFDLRCGALEALNPIAILGKPIDPFALPEEIRRRMDDAAESSLRSARDHWRERQGIGPYAAAKRRGASLQKSAARINR